MKKRTVMETPAIPILIAVCWIVAGVLLPQGHVVGSNCEAQFRTLHLDIAVPLFVAGSVAGAIAFASIRKLPRAAVALASILIMLGGIAAYTFGMETNRSKWSEPNCGDERPPTNLVF